jgi:hypothetical protein
MMSSFTNRIVEPSAERLRELLHYDPATGIFTWLARANSRVHGGDVAGSVNGRGYRQIGIDGRKYRAHRLAFLYMTGEWPVEQIDHINGVTVDNRWANLRPADQSLNNANTSRSKRNTSGYKGVSWHATKRKWKAEIGVNGRRRYLGYFSDPAEAHAAYVTAAEHHFGSFARAK